MVTKDTILFDYLELDKALNWKKKKPNLSDNITNPTIVVVMDAWNYNDFMSKNYILNGLYNTIWCV